MKHPISSERQPKILSMPFFTIEAMLKDRVFNEYVITYVDPYVQADYNRLMLLGMFSILERSGIPHYIVNFSPDFTVGFSKAMLHHDWNDMVEKFPIETDPNHFNQDGHNVLAGILDRHVSNMR